MLQLDLRPGDGIGPFTLGASLWSILAFVRQPQSKTLFPSVQISYDTSTPATSIILVHLHPHLDLLFSGKHQHLHTIALRNLRHGMTASPRPPLQQLGVPSSSVSSTRSSRPSSSTGAAAAGGTGLTVRYRHTAISSQDEVLRRGSVMRHFGPTYEGEVMHYPGVAFLFEDELPSSSTSYPSSSSGGNHKRLTSTDESKRIEVRKITITQRTTAPNGEPNDAFEEVLECPTMDGELKSVVVNVHRGIDMYFFPSSDASPRSLLLNESTAEDIRYELGEPIGIHYKDDDRMAIHGSNSQTLPPNSYFMNYYNHGMDLLLDGESNVLRKIILHSNTIGSPLFQRYKRCPWEIADQASQKKRVTLADSLEDIKAFLGKHSEASQPMQVDRSEDYEALSIPVFSTRLIGFDGIILESISSGQVVAITIY